MEQEKTVKGGIRATLMRIVHHVVSHPVLAIANGADWAVRFHDWSEDTPTLKIRFLACSAANDEEREILHLLRTDTEARGLLFDMALERGAYYPKKKEER